MKLKSIEPLIIIQLLVIVILIVSIISPWTKINLSETKIYSNNVSKETKSSIDHSLLQKSTIYFNDQVEKIPDHFYRDNTQMLLVALGVITIIYMIGYILLVCAIERGIVPPQKSKKLEVLIHFVPCVVIVLIGTLSFIASEKKLNICSFTIETENVECVKLKLWGRYSTSDTIQFDGDISGSGSGYQSNENSGLFFKDSLEESIDSYDDGIDGGFDSNGSAFIIQYKLFSEPLVGYYLLILSCINSIVLSIAHIVRFDKLIIKSQNTHYYSLVEYEKSTSAGIFEDFDDDHFNNSKFEPGLNFQSKFKTSEFDNIGKNKSINKVLII